MHNPIISNSQPTNSRPFPCLIATWVGRIYRRQNAILIVSLMQSVFDFLFGYLNYSAVLDAKIWTHSILVAISVAIPLALGQVPATKDVAQFPTFSSMKFKVSLVRLLIHYSVKVSLTWHPWKLSQTIYRALVSIGLFPRESLPYCRKFQQQT